MCKSSTGLLLASSAVGSRDLRHPLTSAAANDAIPGHSDFTTVRNAAELDVALAAARAAQQPVLLVFGAEWCAACHEMDRDTFADPEVARRLAGYRRLRADVTANSVQDRALLRRFQVVGPPTVIFFDSRGAEQPQARASGYVAPAAFLARLAVIA